MRCFFKKKSFFSFTTLALFQIMVSQKRKLTQRCGLRKSNWIETSCQSNRAISGVQERGRRNNNNNDYKSYKSKLNQQYQVAAAVCVNVNFLTWQQQLVMLPCSLQNKTYLFLFSDFCTHNKEQRGLTGTLYSFSAICQWSKSLRYCLSPLRRSVARSSLIAFLCSSAQLRSEDKWRYFLFLLSLCQYHQPQCH